MTNGWISSAVAVDVKSRSRKTEESIRASAQRGGSELNELHTFERHFVLRVIVELRRAGISVMSSNLRTLKLSTCLEVESDAGGANAVATDCLRDSGLANSRSRSRLLSPIAAESRPRALAHIVLLAIG